MKRKMTDKELGEKLLQVFAGYDAPVRSLAQEAARRLIDGQKTCDNCRYDENPFDCLTKSYKYLTALGLK